MIWLELTIFFLFGLALGSFLNVLIYRLNVTGVPKFWQGRSICPKCKHKLAWRDNIPLLSYFLLSGRCRYCHKTISWQYPVVELTTALVTILVWQYFFPHLNLLTFLPSLLLAYAFIVILFSDLIYGLIPDEMIAVGILLSLINQLRAWGFDLRAIEMFLLTGIASGLAFLLIVLLTRFKGMGMGDVKLALLLGLVLGWPKVLIAVWSAFILGGIVAILLLLLKRTKLSATIPLGPFLVIGTLVSVLWSAQLLHLIGLA